MSSGDRRGLDRRHFLKHLAAMSALAGSANLFVQGLRAAAPELKKQGKSLVILWMGGGPSHMDLWDLKPGQPTGGDFKPIKTAVEGIEISEVLPTVAGQFKNLSIIRSLQSNEGSHERGTTLMNTGRLPNPVVQYPHVGAVAGSLLAAKELALPAFIGVGGTAQRIGPGFLGMTNAPFTVQNPGQPPQNIKAPDALGRDRELEDRVNRRRRLFYAIEERFNQSQFPQVPVKMGEGEEEKRLEEYRNLNSAGQAHQDVYKKAFDLTISPLRNIFEVTKGESKKVIDEYGGDRNQFGMGCLLARRLVEKGVSCVEVDLGGWDNHGNIFPTIRNGNGPRLDKGMGTLVKELVERGLWKNTVLVWMGEFGRTPRINQGAGRDHWGRCWSVVVGGGSIKGGQVYGATNEDGTDILDPDKYKVKVGDLFATLFKGLGLDPSTRIRDNLGRPGPLADGEPIKDLV
ncbi:MAG TPA: DUF1501 domain-containing protein [Gemmataceae bacterium]|nr:DUF1501 domain-containing protein [Gemmataceae bacterium]